MGVDCIDKKDMLILWELTKNARKPLSQIARSVKLPKQTVNYRIKNLKRKGILRKTYSIFNRSKYNFFIFDIYIKTQGLPRDREKKILDELSKIKFIYWFVRLNGNYNYLCSISVTSPAQFHESINKIKSLFGKYLKDMIINIRDYTKRYHYPFFKNKEKLKDNPSNLDRLGIMKRQKLEMVKILSDNAQTSFVDISKKTNLSVKSVAQAIKNFEESGFLKRNTAQLDPTVLGYSFFQIAIVLRSSCPEIEECAERIPEIFYVIKSSGTYDYQIEFYVQDGDRIHEIEQELYDKFGNKIVRIDVLELQKEIIFNYYSGALGKS